MATPTKIIKYTYVGRTTDFKGKCLWEIVGSLKNYGVGRLIRRSMFLRYSEPCFMKIVKVETFPDEERRKVKVWVEKTFRGHTIPEIIPILRASYKTDYNLIPRDEEAELYERAKQTPIPPMKILPAKIDMPPLLKEFMADHFKRKGLTANIDFTMPTVFNATKNNRARIAKDNETPTVQIPMGLGVPANPALYEGLKLE